MNPVRASLNYPQVTIALTLMLVVGGVYALLRMPRREDPKIQVREGIWLLTIRVHRSRRSRTRSRRKSSSASSKSRACGGKRPTRPA